MQRISLVKTILLAVLPVASACALGQFATLANLVPWYAGLTKPAFNPPNWVFGPVWVSLYVLMAIAVWRIVRSHEKTKTFALAAFFTQLALNAAWPWMFFAAHNPLLGLLNILPQLALVVAATERFFRIDKLAGWCLIPLSLWVAYATALNFSIWWLN